MKHHISKTLKHILEVLLGYPFIWLFRFLGLDIGGRLSRRLLRFIGPWTNRHKLIKRNLTATYPDASPREIDRWAMQVWDNMGRIVVEFTNFEQLYREHGKRIKIVNGDLPKQAMEDGSALIIFGAHMGNWEALTIALNITGLHGTIIYQKLSNPFFNGWIMRTRNKIENFEFISKGKDSAKVLIKALKQGHSIAMLTDQKFNKGVAVTFLGRNAMSPSAPANMARRYGAKLMMISCERLEDCNFEVTFHPAFEAHKTDNLAEDIKNTTQKMNDYHAEVINKNPGQWFWLHNRWASK